jgi:hypothetical protein
VYYVASPTALSFGSMQQIVRVETRGYPGIALLITAIAGTGMSVEIDTVRS